MTAQRLRAERYAVLDVAMRVRPAKVRSGPRRPLACVMAGSALGPSSSIDMRADRWERERRRRKEKQHGEGSHRIPAVGKRHYDEAPRTQDRHHGDGLTVRVTHPPPDVSRPRDEPVLQTSPSGAAQRTGLLHGVTMPSSGSNRPRIVTTAQRHVRTLLCASRGLLPERSRLNLFRLAQWLWCEPHRGCCRTTQRHRSLAPHPRE